MAATKITYSKCHLGVPTLEELSILVILKACQGYDLSLLLFNIILEILDSGRSTYKEKRVRLGKKQTKLYFFIPTMITCIENLRESRVSKLLELIGAFHRFVAINKNIKIQKSLYSSH